MSDMQEVFQTATRGVLPDPGFVDRQFRRQRRRGRNRRIGAGVVVGILVTSIAAVALVGSRKQTPVAPPSPTAGAPASGRPHVHLIDLDTGVRTDVPNIDPSATSLSVSPDGTMVTYVGSDTRGGNVIFVANIDGTNVRPLERTGASAYLPRWSPDSSTIVYEQVDQVANDLFLVDVATGYKTQLTHFTSASRSGFYAMAPGFSPDGQTVLFNRVPPHGSESDLWSVPESGGRPTLVHRDAAFGAFSPSGTQIAYVSVRDVIDLTFGDLWVASADGSAAHRLVHGQIEMPRWSPDGARIAFENRGSAIYVVDVTTGETRKIANLDTWPDWVDGRTLIYDQGD